MKKLLDETTDDLTRALLVAGLEHRPPAGNKAQLIVALGAGGALGLFSSNALAWLGTTGGKVTMFGVAVGMAGAVYATVSPGPVSPGPVSPGGPVAREAAVEQSGKVALATRVDPVEVSPAGAVQPPVAPSENAVARAAVVSDSAASEAANAELAGDVGGVLSEGVESPARAARSERRLAKIVAPKRSEPRRNGPLPAVQAPPAVGALGVDAVEGGASQSDARQALARQAIGREGEPAQVGDLDTPGLANSSLDSEVRLVDDMHWAVRRNDREALGRFLETYRASFPDGQLKKEVAEFAARLDRPAR